MADILQGRFSSAFFKEISFLGSIFNDPIDNEPALIYVMAWNQMII